jgi:antitoxin component of RelBE/YafQ-DinJ toxin-antitoxin module
MMQDFQLGSAANERFMKAAEIEKQHKQLMDSLKSDPAKVFKEMGMDPLEFSQRQLEEFIRSQEMTPEQKELAELRRFKEEQELTRQEQQQLQEQKTFEAQVEIHRQEYSTKIVESMDKHSLPRDPAVVSMVADYLYNASEKGIDLPVEVAARLVKEDLTNNVKSLLGQMSGDALFGMLGEDLARKIRDYDLGRVGAKNNKPTQPSQFKSQMKSDTPMTLEQINKKMREDLGL